MMRAHCHPRSFPRGESLALLGMTVAAFFLSASPARAEEPLCSTAYQNAAENYWRIVSDMTQYKAIFDNYDSLCQQYYPDEIARLQPEADRLRDQIASDMKDAPRVITEIFNTILPEQVSESCAAEKITRATVLRNFLSGMKAREKSLNARMVKSGKTLRDPEGELKLCRDLGALAPKIRKALGPALSAPLLTISELNSRFMVGDGGKMKEAFANYRRALLTRPAEK
ncbi:MAG: hypothetical protein JWO78_1166 [Micavibrio sp.]|nr:hypothetical protein [Micavibrio sp.]